ncbi:MAG: mechanosensitive ion channel family protein [Pseudomonadota bacterium]
MWLATGKSAPGNLITPKATALTQAPVSPEPNQFDNDAAMEAVNEWAATAFAAAQSAIEWLVAQGPQQALALAIFLGLFVLLRLFRGTLCGFLRSKKLPSHAARNIASEVVNSTSSLFLLVLSAALVAPFVAGLSPTALGYVDSALGVFLIIQGAIWLRTIIGAVTTGYLDRQPAVDGGPGSTAATLIKTVSGFVIWALAAVMILTNLGFQVGPLVAGLGVGGLAIGLAAQSLFSDLFAALAIIFDRPFVRGDFIIFKDGSYSGKIEKIGMKTTRLRSLTGEQIVIANSQLLDKEIRNFRRMERRRASFDVGVVYSTPHGALQAIPSLIKDAIDRTEGVSFDRSNFKAFGASALEFETVFWVNDREYDVFMARQEAVLLAVHKAFEEAGLEFAFPTRTVNLVQS